MESDEIQRPSTLSHSERRVRSNIRYLNRRQRTASWETRLCACSCMVMRVLAVRAWLWRDWDLVCFPASFMFGILLILDITGNLPHYTSGGTVHLVVEYVVLICRSSHGVSPLSPLFSNKYACSFYIQTLLLWDRNIVLDTPRLPRTRVHPFIVRTLVK